LLRKCNADEIVTNMLSTFSVDLPNLLFISHINFSDLTCVFVRIKVFHTTFNNISVISWRSILFVKELRKCNADEIVTIIETCHIIKIQKINSMIQIRKGSLL
jgi:hypothetical protein